ncbi:TAP-like protein-domain-containing protein [Annulohypoxylon maeteangense]|uniref:TAP-like protein-domain-containing protein n=1 Tax=Annulohypoxylon maeteangense TaxID=1927788 RepID=UPI002008074A|nr:TAP-like protein-domain-containing protein [Annulohypoxylon maeteangense]KAI0886156.1 TAP-like protein-domain-containing protein [Annulohypoxylon maeteangense]
MRSAVLPGFVAGLLSQYAAAETQASSATSFDWTSLKPSTSLEYTPCYEEFKCAKLSVPLDWLNNSTSVNGTSRVNIAIITLPATVDESDPSFGGTIITNPGGPGGSGVSFLLQAGKTMQKIADDTKHYEFLSFDPRGVSYSEPKADCFNDEFSRDYNTLEVRAMGPLDSGLNVVRRQKSLYGSYGKLCASGSEILSYMSTASVARDMVEIVDKIEELRNTNVTTNTKLRSRGGLRRVNQREEKDVARIQYWGLSYGTFLGNSFASMFPGRVGRMILEGVVDAPDYVAGLWSTNLQDTQKDFATLYSTCYDAGSNCSLYQTNDTSPSNIQHRVEALLDTLDESPAQYVSGSHIEGITRTDVINLIFQALYQPQLYFPTVASVLSDAMAGNFTTLYLSLGIPSASNFCPSPAPTSYTWESDALYGVGCGDAVPQTAVSAKDFVSYVSELKAQSPDFAATWASIRLACTGWRLRPKYRFQGPFTTPESDPSNVAGKPSAPLLFLTSQYDPVTPARNAVNMAKQHPGSGVLVQDNPGHATLLVPGKCRDEHVRKYFAEGVVPPVGTVCQPDCKPFEECPEAIATNMKRGLEGAAPVPEWLTHGRLPLGITG